MDEVMINPPITKADEMIMDTVETTKAENYTDPSTTAQVVSNAQPDLSKFVAPRKTRTIIRKYNSKVMRNDPCPCGSGKKYKNCCLKEGIDYNEKRELTAQEMAKLRYGTKTPDSFKETMQNAA